MMVAMAMTIAGLADANRDAGLRELDVRLGFGGLGRGGEIGRGRQQPRGDGNGSKLQHLVLRVSPRGGFNGEQAKLFR